MTGLVAADGKTISQTLAALKAAVPGAGDAGVKAIADESRDIIADEGRRFYIRARKTRKPTRLGGKLGGKTAKTTAGRTTVEAVPAGFWSIVEHGSKAHRIERLGKGKNRRAQLLSAPHGPRPYVLHPGHSSLGRPWAQAMTRVEAMPDAVFSVPVAKVLDKAWNG